MKITFNRKGFEDLRKDPLILRDLHERAERIKAEASRHGEVDGYKVTDLVLEDPRGAVSVMATGYAYRSNRRHNSLIRALDAGKD